MIQLKQITKLCLTCHNINAYKQTYRGLENKGTENPQLYIVGRVNCTNLQGQVNSTPIQGRVNFKPLHGRVNFTPTKGRVNCTPIQGQVNSTLIQGRVNFKPLQRRVNCTVYSVHLLYVLYKDGSIVNKKMFNTWSKAGPSTTPTGNNHLEFSSSLYEKKLKMFYSEYEYFLQYYQVKYL